MRLYPCIIQRPKEEPPVPGAERPPIEYRNIYVGKCSCKDFDRPAYCCLLKPGDVFFVRSANRLGRSYEETFSIAVSFGVACLNANDSRPLKIIIPSMDSIRYHPPLEEVPRA